LLKNELLETAVSNYGQITLRRRQLEMKRLFKRVVLIVIWRPWVRGFSILNVRSAQCLGWKSCH